MNGLSPWTVYWISRLTIIREAAVAMAVISFFVAGIMLCFYFVARGDEAIWGKEILKKLRRCLWVALAASVASAVIAIFTPTTKEAIAIYVLPKVVNSEAGQEAQELPLKLIRLIDKKADELLEQEDSE